MLRKDRISTSVTHRSWWTPKAISSRVKDGIVLRSNSAWKPCRLSFSTTSAKPRSEPVCRPTTSWPKLQDADIDLGATGFSEDESAVLLAHAAEGSEAGEDAEEEIPEAPAEPLRTRAVFG